MTPFQPQEEYIMHNKEASNAVEKINQLIAELLAAIKEDERHSTPQEQREQNGDTDKDATIHKLLSQLQEVDMMQRKMALLLIAQADFLQKVQETMRKRGEPLDALAASLMREICLDVARKAAKLAKSHGMV